MCVSGFERGWAYPSEVKKRGERSASGGVMVSKLD